MRLCIESDNGEVLMVLVLLLDLRLQIAMYTFLRAYSEFTHK